MTPDDFRVQVYGARWYKDPLPACPIADATDGKWPAVSTVKKAWSKPYRKKLPTGEIVPLDAYWAATYVVEHRDELAALEPDEALKMVALSSGQTLNRAAERGTDIHAVIEDLIAGRPVDTTFLSEEAQPFYAACEQFVTDCKPTSVVAEVVAINRTLGFGGTLDAVIEIDGLRYLVDWKTRGGDHGAYEEEAAQIGAYNLAEYIIDNGARQPSPAVHGGLIVSFTADSYQLYPVDLAAAADAFRDMLECWHRKRAGTKTARASIGAPLDLQVQRERLAWLKDRIVELKENHPDAFNELAATWPAGVPTFKQAGHTVEQTELIALALSVVEAKHVVPFGDADPLQARVDAEIVAALVARLKALPADIFEAVRTTARSMGIPNIESHRFRVVHLADIEPLIVDAEQAAMQRTSPDVHEPKEHTAA